MLSAVVLLSYSGCGRSSHYIQKPTGQQPKKKKKKKPKPVKVPEVVLKQKKGDRIVEPEIPVQLDSNGNAIFEIEKTIDFETCYVVLKHLPDRNRSALQIKSYKTLEENSYPSFFAYATVDDQLLATLAGETVSCKIYFQLQPDGPIWSTRNSNPVKIQVISVKPQFKARLLPTALTATGHGRTTQVSGKITAALLEDQ